MHPRFPLMLPLEAPSPVYRWRLVASVYASAGVIVEGSIVLIVSLTICALRTHVMAFLWLGAASVVITSARLWDCRQFKRSRAAALAGQTPGEPEYWMARHAAGAVVASALWGGQDIYVLLLTHDTSMQFIVLLFQAGWIAGACVRMAACPAAVIGQIVCSLVPTVACLFMVPSGPIQIVIPAGMLHIVATLRMSQSLGLLLSRTIQSERRVEIMNTQLAEANAKLTHLSLVDGLTGIANRRAFDEALDAEWSRARREASPLALLMVDVDFFKLYNDRYGHLAGDACLRHVAVQVAANVSRRTDVTARYGGEEFVTLLPSTDEQGALEAAERLRAAIAAARMPHEAAPSGSVSVSIGVASLVPVQGVDRQALIRLADGALYDAKRGGRNRVHAAAAAAIVANAEAMASEVVF